MINIKINKNSPTPTYYQIQKQIRDLIENEEIPLGAKLPSERELNDKINVSRDTIRKAINNLIDEGYCTKKVGKGIFVSAEKIPFNITNLKGTTTYIEKLGLEIQTEIIDKNIISANKVLQNKLNIKDNDKVFYLKRIRNIDGNPLILEETHLPLKNFLDIDKAYKSGSLYELLETKYKTKPKKSKGNLNFKLANEKEANLLNVKLNAALMSRKAIVYSEDELPIEYCLLTCRSDKFTFLYNSNVTN